MGPPGGCGALEGGAAWATGGGGGAVYTGRGPVCGMITRRGGGAETAGAAATRLDAGVLILGASGARVSSTFEEGTGGVAGGVGDATCELASRSGAGGVATIGSAA